jgi:hypothetical protein
LTGTIAALFADGGFKVELGVNGMFVPFSGFFVENEPLVVEDGPGEYTPQPDGGVSDLGGIVLPLLTLGLYGHVDFGPVHLGTGLQGYSVILGGILYPAVYAEVDIWKFTLNTTVGGYGFFVQAGLMPLFFLRHYIVPDVSVWFRHKSFKFGVGATTLMDTHAFPAYFSPFSVDKLLFYTGFRWTL